MTFLKKITHNTVPALALAVAVFAAPHHAAASSDPLIGEIAPTGITGFCPRGWADASGQILPIASNTALFSLLGTTFGGDGRTSFGLPDLRSRHPIGAGTGPGLQPRSLGQKAGIESTVLTTQQLAAHSHLVNATNSDGDKPGPGSKILAAAPMAGVGQETIYSTADATVQMSPTMISVTGSHLPVSVVDPTLVIRYCIALQGVFPSRP